MNQSILFAVLAALLFGASTPFAKLLVNEASPIVLGGMLYLGSGLGLGLSRLIRDRGWKNPGMTATEWLWLLGAIFFGGVLGPVALMFGLTHSSTLEMSSFVWFSWGWVLSSAFAFSLSVLPGATAFLSITAAGSLALFGFGPRGQATMQLAASTAIQDFAFAGRPLTRPRTTAFAVKMDGLRLVISALIARCWCR